MDAAAIGVSSNSRIELLERQAEVLLDDLPRLFERKGRDLVLERLQLEDDVRRNDVRTGREELAELDEGRPELVEHLAQALAPRRPFRVDLDLAAQTAAHDRRGHGSRTSIRTRAWPRPGRSRTCGPAAALRAGSSRPHSFSTSRSRCSSCARRSSSSSCSRRVTSPSSRKRPENVAPARSPTRSASPRQRPTTSSTIVRGLLRLTFPLPTSSSTSSSARSFVSATAPTPARSSSSAVERSGAVCCYRARPCGLARRRFRRASRRAARPWLRPARRSAGAGSPFSQPPRLPRLLLFERRLDLGLRLRLDSVGLRRGLLADRPRASRCSPASFRLAYSGSRSLRMTRSGVAMKIVE